MTHPTNRVYYLHEDGFAHAISIEKDPKINLVVINKKVYHISFNLTSGILQTRGSFYRRMENRTIIVAAENVSIYIYIYLYRPYSPIRAFTSLMNLSQSALCFDLNCVEVGVHLRAGHEGSEGSTGLALLFL